MVWLQMTQIRCFMYVSTAYANAHLGPRSPKEQLYPVIDEQGHSLDHSALARHLLSLPATQAQDEVQDASHFPLQIYCCPAWF